MEKRCTRKGKRLKRSGEESKEMEGDKERNWREAKRGGKKRLKKKL